MNYRNLAIVSLIVSIFLILIGSRNIDVAFNRYHLAYHLNDRKIVEVKDLALGGFVDDIDKVYAVGQTQVVGGVVLNLLSITFLFLYDKKKL